MRSKEERVIRRAAWGAAMRATVVYAVACGLWLAYSEGVVQAFSEQYPWLAWVRHNQSVGFAIIGGVGLFLLAARAQLRAKLTEFNHIESERARSTVLGNLPGIAYRCTNDFVRTMQFVSDGCVELTGYRPEDFIDNRRLPFDQVVHPDDVEMVHAGIAEAVSRHQRYRLVYRVVTATGEERWVLDHGCGVEEQDGRYVTLEGLMVDISRQKEYEQKLTAHQGVLEARVAERTQELSEFSEMLERRNAELTDEVERRTRAEAELREVSFRDALTGLFNRRRLDEVLREEVDRCDRYGHALSVVMIDLDYFKVLNDTYGHQVGDDALRMVAAILRGGLRTSDKAARYGGEEMTLVLPETSGQEAWAVADRLRKAVAGHPMEVTAPDGSVTSIEVTFSAGVASFPEDGRTPEAIFASADRALYRAKHGGRNRVCRVRTSAPTPLRITERSIS